CDLLPPPLAGAHARRARRGRERPRGERAARRSRARRRLGRRRRDDAAPPRPRRRRERAPAQRLHADSRRGRQRRRRHGRAPHRARRRPERPHRRRQGRGRARRGTWTRRIRRMVERKIDMRRLPILLLLLSAATAAHAAVTGTVAGSDGAPLAGARVRAFAREPFSATAARLLSATPDPTPLATAQSDAEGRYSVDTKG